mgnify:FL=1
MDLGLYIIDGVCRLNVKSDGLSSQSFDEDLHSSSKSENQVKSGLLLDVVIAESSVIFKLLSSEDESLLIWRNTFLVLDFSFDVVNGVSWFNIEGDSLSSESLNKDLHSTSKSKD